MKKYLVYSVIVLSGLFVNNFCFAITNSLIPSSTREIISLNGGWDVQETKNDKPVFPAPAQQWGKTSVPDSRLDSFGNTNTIFFRKFFTVPSEWQGKNVNLEFVGVCIWSRVYLNGEFIGENFNSKVPFSFDVSKKIKYGSENELIVWVTSVATEENTFPSVRGNHGFGIIGPVSLVAYPDVYIEDVFVKPSVRKKSLDLEITVINHSDNSAKVSINNLVYNFSKGKSVSDLELAKKFEDSAPMLIESGKQTTINLSFAWDNANLWSPDNPHLYVLKSLIKINGKDTDELYARFGFREFWIEGDHFMLNGVRCNLMGLWSAFGGYMESLWSKNSQNNLYQELISCKKSNINVLRLYIPLPNFLYDSCDELGIMLLGAPEFSASPQLLVTKDIFWKISEETVKSSIKLLRNHPSIVIWSLSNEEVQTAGSRWQDHVNRLWHLQLAAREVDPTRPAFHSGSGALQDRGEIVSVHYPKELNYGQGSSRTDIPNMCYYSEGAKEIQSAWLQYKEPLGKKPLAISETGHAYIYGPHELYFILGEDIYVKEYNGELASDGKFGRWSRDTNLGFSTLIDAYRDYGVPLMVCCAMIPAPNEIPYLTRAYLPLCVNIREKDTRFYSGDESTRTLTLLNDRLVKESNLKVIYSLKSKDKEFFTETKEFKIAGGEKERFTVKFKAPEVKEITNCEFVIKVIEGDKELFNESHKYIIYPVSYPDVKIEGKIALYDFGGNTVEVLKSMKVKFDKITNLEEISYDKYKIAVIGKNSLTKDTDINTLKTLNKFVSSGGYVVILEQDDLPMGWLPIKVDTDSIDTARAVTMVQKIADKHYILKDVSNEELKYWRGDHYVVKRNYIKPTVGNFRPLVGYGCGSILQCDYTGLLELPYGKGSFLISQLLLVEKFGKEPIAAKILANILNYSNKISMANEKAGLIVSTDSKEGEKFDEYLKLLNVDNSRINLQNNINFSEYSRIILFLEKDLLNPEQIDKLKNWIQNGGKLVIFLPDNKEGLYDTIKNFITVDEKLTSQSLNQPMLNKAITIKDTKSDLTDGISNADLYWLPLNAEILSDRFFRFGKEVVSLIKDSGLGKMEYGKGEIVVCQLRLSQNLYKSAPLRIGSVLLTNLGIKLNSSLQEVSPTVSYFQIDLRPYCNMGFKDEVDGDQKGGWTDQGINDMRNIPVGKLVVKGMPFDIIDPDKNNGKSCIVLKGGAYTGRTYFPVSVDKIPVNDRADYLYFLIACAWTGEDKTQAHILVEYPGFDTTEILVRAGKEVLDWYAPGQSLENSIVGWVGSNSMRPVTTYILKWKNPRNEPIKSISFQSTGEGVPILIAIIGQVKESDQETKSSKILFQDDFSDESYTKKNWTWSNVTKEGMEMACLGSGAETLTGEDNWTDYILEVKMKFIQFGNNSAGFEVRNNERNDNKLYICYGKGGSNHVFNIKSTGQWVPAKMTRVKNQKFKENQWYQFKIICEGDKIEIYVDGDFIETIEEDRVPASGKIGLVVFDQHAAFKDVKVTSLKK